MPDEKKPIDEEKLVAVGEGAEDAPEESVEKQVADEKKSADGDVSDERVGHEEEADDDANAPEGETVEQKRERRRGERQRRRHRESMNRKELNFLRQRNESLERRQSELALRQDVADITTMDTRVSGFDQQIRQAEQIHSQAVKAGDGDTATEALRIRDELKRDRDKIADSKEQKTKEVKEAAARPTTNGKTEGPPPAVVEQAMSWMERNSWFDKTLNDETSHLVKVMEDRLGRENELRADTPEYWKELDRRVAARFPHLKKKSMKSDDIDWGDDDDDAGEKTREKTEIPAKKKTGGPRLAVGGRERALGKNEVYIDSERRKALEDAGLWDDPDTRQRYLKSYRTYDKAAADKN